MTALNEWLGGIDLSRMVEWLMFAAAALISISVHESSHALAALALGDDTAKKMGRISLNPLHHLDLVGFVMMVVAHFGWARPVPINPYRMTKINSPRLGMALSALAGPLSNVVLGFVSCLLYCILFRSASQRDALMLAGALAPSGWYYYLTQFSAVCMVLNAGLAVFNLLPVSPLDGSKILAIVLPEKWYFQLMRYERYGMLVLLALLMFGVLDGPLTFLREGLIEGFFKLANPISLAVAA